jgi:Zn-finger nucleic acid-binding protein
MRIEALNCPNCGANVGSDSSFCRFCGSRLKTMACARCLGLMFVGAKHCSHCGEQVAEIAPAEREPGKCPRCGIALVAMSAEVVELDHCERCEGMWIGVAAFERVCADQERQAAVLRSIGPASAMPPVSIRYVPCPACGRLMNRSNFARSSGVIIDTCREHGVWFDADELPKIIEFIRKGGIDRQRDKEKTLLDEQRRELIERERAAALRESRFRTDDRRDRQGPLTDFIRSIFD